VTPDADLRATIEEAASRGHGHVLAAGGDGTVSTIVNMIMSLPEPLRQRVVLGAVGLGSSNDFHKPFEVARMIEGIPLRTNFKEPTWRDVGRAILTQDGTSSVRYFIINASAGIAAEGNARFNAPDRLLRLFKQRATPVAILYAALRAIMAHENRECTLEMRGRSPVKLSLTNLGIVKNPHFSGSLRYDTPPHYADGNFGIHAAERMGLIERLRLLCALAHGRFRGVPKTRSWVSPALTLTASAPFTLELDGETDEVTRAEFTVVPHAIQVCS
jgi:diacylglycerol kinase family enzyme